MLQQAISRLSDLAHEIPRTEAALAEIGQRKAEVALALSGRRRKGTRADLDGARETDQEHRGAAGPHAAARTSSRPVSGIINKLNVTTVGGVVKPGEALAEIVPADGSIDVEMKLSPADRADVWPGQRAIVKVSAYEYSVYGGLSARSLGNFTRRASGRARRALFPRPARGRRGGAGPDHPVLPGMLADVDVIGNRQSVLGTILKPLRRIKDNALRQ